MAFGVLRLRRARPTGLMLNGFPLAVPRSLRERQSGFLILLSPNQWQEHLLAACQSAFSVR
jgi:hypothetical protein